MPVLSYEIYEDQEKLSSEESLVEEKKLNLSQLSEEFKKYDDSPKSDVSS